MGSAVASIVNVQIGDLLLDAKNPRITVELLSDSQEDLAVHLALAQEALTVAESIASHGFFASEPLVVLSTDGGKWLVLEGNRRLTALLGLADPAMRSHFPEPDRWDQLAAKAGLHLSSEVPVSVVESRDDAAAIIGFRHIVGVLNWSPYAQALYVARLVDEEGKTFADVADILKMKKTRVAGLYRDQAIAVQARNAGLDTGSLENAFSLLTVTMGHTPLREHAGAPEASKTEAGAPPVATEDMGGLQEVLAWVFGTAERDAVITDSREIGRLSKVVGTSVGLAALRKTGDLSQAHQAVQEQDVPPRDTVVRTLKTARSSLSRAAEFASDFRGDAELDALLADVEETLESVAEALRGASDPD